MLISSVLVPKVSVLEMQDSLSFKFFGGDFTVDPIYWPQNNKWPIYW